MLYLTENNTNNIIYTRSYQRLIHCFLNTIKHFLFSADGREQANYFLILYDLSLLCNWINRISRDRYESTTFWIVWLELITIMQHRQLFTYQGCSSWWWKNYSASNRSAWHMNWSSYSWNCCRTWYMWWRWWYGSSSCY
jgi:hypothetical protein